MMVAHNDDSSTNKSSTATKTKCVFALLVVSALILFGGDFAILQPLPFESSTTRTITTTTTALHHSSRISFLRNNHSHPATQALWNRYEAYVSAGEADRWRFRGLGYLWMEHNVILEASVDLETQSVIRIENVMEGSTTIDCDRLTLWVRVHGPEIFAGKPRAVKDASRCWWEFDFPIAIDGTYAIDVKLLTWNGRQASIIGHPNNVNFLKNGDVQCPMETGGAEAVDEEKLTGNHSSMRAFKLYQPVHGCCEFCTRQYPHCIAWATPPASINATAFNNGCEFYYAPDAPAIPRSLHIIKQRHRALVGAPVPHFHGTPHDNPHDTAYFMGCGWSSWFTLDFPCISGDLDDRVHTTTPEFDYNSVIKDAGGTRESNPQRLLQNEKDLPLCTLEHEALTDTESSAPNGRWIHRPFPNDTECPLPMIADGKFNSKFTIMAFDPERPQCWHRDDFSMIGNKCLEMNCRLIPPNSIWRSALHNTTHVYVVWKPYACDYIELTDAELQTCVDTHQIGAFQRNGASVAEFLDEYMQQRLQNIRLVEGGKTITLSTLALLHKIGIRDDMFLNEPDFKLLEVDEEHLKDIFWVSGYFLSSERAVHGHVDRMDWSNRQVVQRYPKSQMLNAFDMSAAFTYDTATQMDGMHIIGPPMKMVVTKLFHHVCKDIVPNARRVGEEW